MQQETSTNTRPWLFVGTIPDADFPLVLSPFTFAEQAIEFGTRRCTVNRGTPAMLAAAFITYTHVARGVSDSDMLVLAAGDTGKGQGSQLVYKKLVEALAALAPRGITFHYLLPDVDWHNRILMAVDELPERPVMVADAGYMYSAKMSGYANRYDLFTPDVGELAFLADERAPHPFYTRNFMLADEERAEELAAKARADGNSSEHMLVKGKIDRYMDNKTIAAVDGPDVPMLEPIGGTGDSLTGIASALLAGGASMREACTSAIRINRRMGFLAQPTPASSILDILDFLPSAILHEKKNG